MNLSPAGDAASSWTCIILFAIFFTVCMRVRGNFKFVGALFRDLVMVRERENMFDSTMRETSFIFLTLLLSGCSMGVLLRHAVVLWGDRFPLPPDFPVPSVQGVGELGATALCMGVACVYIGAMWVCYNVVGRVFTDSQHTWAWVRGFTAGTGLAAALFFPLALLSLAYPDYVREITIFAFLMLILVKITFVIKGFRIFFTESSLWVVFLYYLCSLEIVPLVITYGLACMMPG